MAGLKNSPVADALKKLGAKTAPAEGWNVAVSFPGGSAAEHRHTRSAVSLFDLSNIGELQLSGVQCGAALDALLTDAASALPVGSVMHTYLKSGTGLLGEVTLLHMAENDYFLAAENCPAVLAQLEKQLPSGIAVRDLSEALIRFDVEGSHADEVMAEMEISPDALPAPGEWKIVELPDPGLRCIVTQTGEYGETGYEFYFSVEFAAILLEDFLDCPGVQLAGWNARETLRFEAGALRRGHELAPDIPVERLHSQLAGAVLTGRLAPLDKSEVKNGAGETIGTVTSGLYCPTLDAPAVRFLTERPVKPGDILQFAVNGKNIDGKITEVPFYRRKR